MPLLAEKSIISTDHNQIESKNMSARYSRKPKEKKQTFEKTINHKEFYKGPGCQAFYQSQEMQLENEVDTPEYYQLIREYLLHNDVSKENTITRL